MNNSKQSVSREEYRRLDNRVTCILQRRWSVGEIRQWVAMLQGKQQAVACAILRRRFPRPERLALPDAGAVEPMQQASQQRSAMVTITTADGRAIGKRHTVEGKRPVIIAQCGTVRCASTGHSLWIAPGSHTDRANPGRAAQLNPTYSAASCHVVADHSQRKAGE